MWLCASRLLKQKISFLFLSATAYGKGVYFAVEASYSVNPTYARPDANGHQYLYQCKVLTGEFTTGDDSLIVAPSKDSNDPNIRYDSVVDDPKSPTMYIVFSDTQAYPEYLIIIK